MASVLFFALLKKINHNNSHQEPHCSEDLPRIADSCPEDLPRIAENARARSYRKYYVFGHFCSEDLPRIAENGPDDLPRVAEPSRAEPKLFGLLPKHEITKHKEFDRIRRNSIKFLSKLRAQFRKIRRSKPLLHKKGIYFSHGYPAA